MKQVQLAIIGGGPAGLAAAIAAREKGVEDILIIERDKELGASSTSASTQASACTPSARS
ncbi:MAG: FAD-dependent oxidoreductase [Oscillospiraceae bacterium]